MGTHGDGVEADPATSSAVAGELRHARNLLGEGQPPPGGVNAGMLTAALLSVCGQLTEEAAQYSASLQGAEHAVTSASETYTQVDWQSREWFRTVEERQRDPKPPPSPPLNGPI